MAECVSWTRLIFRVNLPIADTIHSTVKKFVTNMEIKATGYKSTNDRLKLAECTYRLSFARPKGVKVKGKKS